MDFLINYFSTLPGPAIYLAAFGVLLACGIGVPIPEDITLFAMGLFSYYGKVNLAGSIFVCLVGVLLGDSIIFYLGHHFGPRLAKKGIFAKLLHPERMDAIKSKFQKKGPKVILAARFMPGFRAPTYFSAGTLGVPYSVFIFYDGLAALLSVPALVSVAYYFGDQLDYAITLARKVQNGITIVIFILILLFVLKHLWMKRRNAAKASS